MDIYSQYGQDQIYLELETKFNYDNIQFYNTSDNQLIDIENMNKPSYMFFVVDWDDKENNYETISDVIADWPENLTELMEKQINNLYKPQFISSTFELGLRNKLKNNYTTPGIKTI